MPTGPSWEEFKAQKKANWKMIHSDRLFAIFAKKKCPTCGTVFNCHDCYMEYYLCSRSTDYKKVSEGPWTECECPKCLKKSLGMSVDSPLRSGEQNKSNTTVRSAESLWASEK